MTENELILKVQSGDRDTFRELLELHRDRVYNTALGFLQNRQDAEDITQEVFVEVYESIGGFKGNSKFSTWIYRITITKCLDFIRRKRRRKRFGFIVRLSSGSADDRHLPEPADFVHPGVIFENKERAAALFKEIALLPDSQKMAFTLCYVEGLSHSEIAEILHTSISAVESLLHRAKHELRNRLRDRYQSGKFHS